MNNIPYIVAIAVESYSKISLTMEQRNMAVDEDLIHYDGVEWKFFKEDLEKLEALKKI